MKDSFLLLHIRIVFCNNLALPFAHLPPAEAQRGREAAAVLQRAAGTSLPREHALEAARSLTAPVVSVTYQLLTRISCAAPLLCCAVCTHSRNIPPSVRFRLPSFNHRPPSCSMVSASARSSTQRSGPRTFNARAIIWTCDSWRTVAISRAVTVRVDCMVRLIH